MELTATCKTSILFFVFFCWGGWWIHTAQAHEPRPVWTITEGRPLSEVLEELGEKYQVFFSYNAKALSRHYVQFDFQEGESFDKAISRLLMPTQYGYQTYGDKYFVIYEKTKAGRKDVKKLKRNIERIRKLEHKGNLSIQRKSMTFRPQHLTRTLAFVEQSIPVSGNGYRCRRYAFDWGDSSDQRKAQRCQYRC